MTDFTTNIDMNVRMMNEKLRVDRNFDILQRDVLIGGKRTHFYFIDGFVQEETIEKLVQFFYSLKESDIKDIDTFLEVGMPYTEIEKNGHYDEVEKAFLSGQTVMIIDGFDECILIDCRTYPMRSVTEPYKDKVLRGSRDGFVETLVCNAALLRRRIRDSRFSMEMYTVGERSDRKSVV